jgi:hypothetical protein
MISSTNRIFSVCHYRAQSLYNNFVIFGLKEGTLSLYHNTEWKIIHAGCNSSPPHNQIACTLFLNQRLTQQKLARLRTLLGTNANDVKNNGF